MKIPTAEEVALAQGFYYVATGLWPLAHMGSFARVTGPKTDLWLVKTTGLLIAVIGAALVVAGWSGGPDATGLTLAVGAALALAAVDVVYSVKDVISRVFLLDALVEAALICAWVAVWASVSAGS